MTDFYESIRLSDDQKEFFLLQVNDPTFPIGAYSHSFGLETYIVKELITSPEETLEYLKNYLTTTFLYTDFLSVHLAYKFIKSNQLDLVTRLDETLSALKNPQELRQASHTLGNRYRKTVLDILPDLKSSNQFRHYLLNNNRLTIDINYAVIYGVICSILQIDESKSLASFIYCNTSGIVTNAAKSVPISQTAGQQIISHLYPIFVDLVEKVQKMSQADLGFSVPGFDMQSMQHETLYTRLYIS